MVIGVTGCIGAGKSTVSEIFRKIGAEVIDADTVGHKMLESEPVKKELKRVFGEEIIENKKVSRKRLAKIVFSGKDKVAQLNKITHPPIVKEIEKMIDVSTSNLIVITAPFLLESDLHKLVDISILIKTDRERIIERLKSAGWDEEEIRKRMRFHPEDSNREPYCDFVIDNNSRIEATEAQVKRILDEISVF
jgi:dephospho-CoA kinase